MYEIFYRSLSGDIHGGGTAFIVSAQDLSSRALMATRHLDLQLARRIFEPWMKIVGQVGHQVDIYYGTGLSATIDDVEIRMAKALTEALDALGASRRPPAGRE
jgi:hypothetical protein